MVLLLVILFEGCFVPVDGFQDLDAVAGPFDFGFLLICSGEPEADSLMSEMLLESLVESVLPDTAEVKLYIIPAGASGYGEVARLAGRINGYPAIVTLVGHCGFIELDTTMLTSEIEDAWFRWGTGNSAGICNHCRRCNP